MTCSGEEREKVREFKYLKSTVIGRDKTEINVDVSERKEDCRLGQFTCKSKKFKT